MKIFPSRILPFILLFAAATLTSHAEIRIQVQPKGNDGDGKENIVVPKPTTGVDAVDPSTPATGAPSDVLFFDNNDSMHGRLLSINPQTGVRWKHPESKQPIDFSENSITRIKLERRKSAAQPAPANCIIRLTNNDELMGNLISMDAEKLELDTWYAGKVSILRKMVKSITPTQGAAVNLYEGPTSLDGWVQGQGQKSWTYSNGMLISAGRAGGSIGRDMKLPAVSSIDFDLSWRGMLALMLCFYTDSFEVYNGNSNAYTLNINQGSMYLQRMRRDGGSAQIGNANVQSMQTKTKAHISIRCNKEQSSIWLFVDGAIVQQWKDPAGFAGSGTGLLFYAQGNGVNKLSNIRISEWDGKMDDQPGASTKTKEDAVRLVNNDKVSGKIQTIRDGKLAFATSYATLDIAMPRVTQIDMADEQAEQAKRNAGDVRAVFADRGRITIQLEQWDDKQVIGSSQNFGKLKLNPSAFGMIQFNLDREKTPSNDETSLDPEAGE